MKDVTIVSGFLGAGKTSFLNALLNRFRQVRFGIIENELGKVSIDDQLLKVNISEEMPTEVLLSSGCICCSLNEDFVEALGRISQSTELDHLLIETTGVAEPDSVLLPFLKVPALQEQFKVKHVVIIIDAYNIQSLWEEPLVLKQISTATTLLLNKVDLFSGTELEKVITRLRRLNPFAKVVFGRFGEPEDWTFWEENISTQRLKELGELIENEKIPHGGYRAVLVEVSEPLDMMKFKHWMQVVLQIQYERILRVKGWVHFHGISNKMLFQSVSKQMVFEPAEDSNGVLPKTQLVFIGKGLDAKKIEEWVRKCIYKG